MNEKFDLAALRAEALFLSGQTGPNDAAVKMLAGFVLALTDPTPLTVGVLVGMGGIRDEKAEVVRFGESLKVCYWPNYPRKFRFYVFGDGPLPLLMQPRTAGELRQLLGRMEKR